MPTICIIQKDSNGRITRVNTPTGQRSTLFDKLLGMAPVSDAVKAAKALMTVYSSKFKERFGDWERVPIINDSLDKLRRGRRILYRTSLRYRFIGERGASSIADERMRQEALDNLILAKELERRGYDMDKIWRMTGWLKPGDGKWRMEMYDKLTLSDKFMDEAERVLNGGPDVYLPLSEAVGEEYYEELVSEYPAAASLRVLISGDTSDGYGYYLDRDNAIAIVPMNNRNGDKDEMAKSFIHEAQHFIQDMEGFSIGGNVGSVRDLPIYKEAKERLTKSVDRIRAAMNSIIESNEEYRREFERYKKATRYEAPNAMMYTDEMRDYIDELDSLDKEIETTRELIGNPPVDMASEDMTNLLRKMVSLSTRRDYLLSHEPDNVFRPVTESEAREIGEIEDRLIDITDRIKETEEYKAATRGLEGVELKLNNLDKLIYWHLYGEMESRTAERRFSTMSKRDIVERLVPWEIAADAIIDDVFYVNESDYNASLNDIRDAAMSVGEKLNVRVIAVSRSSIAEIVPDPETRDAMLGSKGWYDVNSGEIYVVPENNADASDAGMTVLHEALAHKGLRYLLGNRFEEGMRNIFAMMDPGKQAEYMAKYGDEVTAAEEYVANMAEEFTDISILDRIIGFLRDLIRRVTKLSINKGDLLYLLHRSKKALSRMDTIMEENKRIDDSPIPGGVTYPSGEPRLFFRSDDGKVKGSYTEAVQGSPSGKVNVGFLAGTTGDASADISVNNGEVTLNNEEAFVPVMTVDSTADVATRPGYVNYLVKKGLLSGERVNRDGKMVLTGAGEFGIVRMLNASTAAEMLKARFGGDAATVNQFGEIEFDTEVDTDTIEVIGKDGDPQTMSRSEAEEMIRQGRYSELDRRIEDASDIAVSMIYDEARKKEAGVEPLSRSIQEEGNSIRSALMDILSSLGIRVIGMQEYIDNYGDRNGTPITVKALADLANGVVALAEGATVLDLAEETAHFLIDTYINQAEIDEILPSVHGTPQWDKYAKRYYEIYGRDYQGAELDRMVEREILGKILRDKFVAGQSVESMESSSDSHISLLGRIIRAIRNFFTNQRSRMDEVMDRVKDFALSGDMTVFDPSLVSETHRVMYSATDVDYAKRLMRFKRSLERTFRNLQALNLSRTAMLGETIRTLKETEAALAAAKDNSDAMNSHSVVSAMQSIISTAEAQVRYMTTAAKSLKKRNGKRLDYDTSRIIDEVYNTVIPMVKQMQGLVKDSPAGYFENRESMLERMRSIITTAEEANSDIEETRRRNMDGFVDEFCDKYNIQERHRDLLKKGVNSIMKDIGFMARFFGTLEHSSNPILAMLGYALTQVAQKARSEAIRRTDPMIRLIEKNGFTVKDYEKLISKGPDDSYSDFLIASRDLAAYEYNRRLEEANALYDIYMLDKVHPDKSREEIVKEIMSDKGFKTARKVMRPAYDKDGNLRKDANDEIINEPVDLTEPVVLAANRRPMDYTVMDMTEKALFDQRMSKWHEENDERMFKDEYYKKFADIEDEFKKLNRGKPLSEETREFMTRIRKDRYAVLSRFMDQNGEVDYEELSKDSAAVNTLRDIKADMDAARSVYNLDGSMKTGVELTLANELNNWDKAVAEINKDKGDRRLSRKILDIVEKIQRNQGPRAAMDFLFTGASLGFKSEMFGPSVASRFAEAVAAQEAKGNKFGEKDIKARDKGEKAAMTIDSIRGQINSILSQFRNGARYGEYDISLITGNQAVKRRLDSLYERMAYSRRRLSEAAAYFGVEMAEIEGVENDVSDSYKEVLREWMADTPGGKEYQFAERYMSNQRIKMLDSMATHLMSGNPNDLTAFEKRFVERYYGMKFNDIYSELARMPGLEYDGSEYPSAVENILDAYSRVLVHPYCKISSPMGYSDFQKRLNRGEIDVVRMLRDIESKNVSRETSIDRYGFDINMMNLYYNSRWLEDSEQMMSLRNPDYDPSLGYGAHIPKLSKYKNAKYYDFFGIENGNEHGEATRNKELWDLRKAFLDINRETLDNYGDSWRGIYGIPQVSKSMTERFHTSYQSVKGAIRNYLQDVAGERVDDPLYGQRVAGAADGARQIPKYYVYKLENSDDVSHDLGYSFGLMALQGSRYKYKKDALEDIMGLETLARQAEWDGGKVVDGTKAFRQFIDWVDAGIYDINVAKLLNTLTKWSSSFNIGFSHVVALTGALTGQTNMLIEGALGTYLDKESLRFAYGETMRQMPSFVSEVGDLNRKNKIFVLGEHAGVFDVNNRIRSTAYNKIWRTLFRDMPYKLLEVLNTPLDLQIVAGIAKDTRLFYLLDSEGKPTRQVFGSFNEFKQNRLETKKDLTEESIREEWRSIENESMYDLIDTSDGKIKAVRPELQELVDKYYPSMSVKMRSLSQIAGGYLDENNRVSASRNMILSLVLQHRGWLILSVQRAWKKKGINLVAGEEEEGYMRTFFGLMRSIYTTSKNGRMSEILSVISEEYNKLSDFEKRNVKRAGLDLGLLIMFNLASFALLGYQDDDKDDWVAQYVPLIGFRYMNEMIGQMGLPMIPGMIDTIQEPFVVARKVGDLLNLPAWTGTVESGIYEGYPGWVRQLMRLTWGKQLFNYMTPEDVRQTYEYWRINNKMTVGLASGWPRVFMKEAS